MTRLVILGRPVSTTNSRRIAYNRRTGRRFTIKSKAYAAWAVDAIAQLAQQRIKPRRRTITHPVAVTLTVFRERNTGDLDNFAKGALDALQESGWLEDDAQVVALHMHKDLDRENPRIEILIETAA
jgi:Holliday junction resolvase RusA-like endonuclease